jgi:uncharacterized integral membrane protein
MAKGVPCGMADEEEPHGETPRRRRLNARVVFVLLLLALFVVFVSQNDRKTRVDFLVEHVTARLWILLVVSAVVGVVLGALVARPRRR